MEAFSSKDLAMRAQKKILSRMATKASIQMFIDDTTSEILDELYHVSKDYTANKTEAQKVIKDLIKIAVKIGVLFRNNRFSVEELKVAQEFKKKLNQGAMTAISFYEVQCCVHLHQTCPKSGPRAKCRPKRNLHDHLTPVGLLTLSNLAPIEKGLDTPDQLF